MKWKDAYKASHVPERLIITAMILCQCHRSDALGGTGWCVLESSIRTLEKANTVDFSAISGERPSLVSEGGGSAREEKRKSEETSLPENDNRAVGSSQL